MARSPSAFRLTGAQRLPGSTPRGDPGAHSLEKRSRPSAPVRRVCAHPRGRCGGSMQVRGRKRLAGISPGGGGGGGDGAGTLASWLPPLIT